jgi:2-polyprenyl-3-methyl-5-hydroxy-6-metoxy-1,4-benzoquinol methylase
MAFTVDLRRRRCRPEIMDQPGLDRRRHHHALFGLERINRWSGSAGILWPPIGTLAREASGAPLRLLDIATGAGDVPVRLWHKARRAGVELAVDGCDLSPQAVDYAAGRANRARAAVRFFVWNALADPLPPGYDIVTCSLFLHHLSDEQALLLLRRMSQMARRLVLVNDLRRSLAGYLMAYVGTRLLSTSPVVHTDGPRSVEAAFQPEEALALAVRAGLRGATVRRRWPFRFLLTWEPPAPAAAGEVRTSEAAGGALCLRAS